MENTQQGVLLATMLPLDKKNYVSKLSELKDLGKSNYKAFYYYRGLIIFCQEDKKRYEWTDVFEEKSDKILKNNFTYPGGTIIDGVNYSGLEFNFIEYKTSSGSFKEYNSLEEARLDLDSSKNEMIQFVINKTNSENEFYIYQGLGKKIIRVINEENAALLKSNKNSSIFTIENADKELGLSAIDLSVHSTEDPYVGFKKGALGPYSFVTGISNGAEGFFSFVGGVYCFSQGQSNHIISSYSLIREKRGSLNRGKFYNEIFGGYKNEIDSASHSGIFGGRENKIIGNADGINYFNSIRYTEYNAIVGGIYNTIEYNLTSRTPPFGTVIIGGARNKAKGHYQFVTGYLNHAVTNGECLVGLYGTIQDLSLSGFDYVHTSRMFNVGIGDEDTENNPRRKDGFSVFRNGLVTIPSITYELIEGNLKSVITYEYFKEKLDSKIDKNAKEGDIVKVTGVDQNNESKQAKVVDVIGTWDASSLPTEQQLIENYPNSLFVYAVSVSPMVMYMRTPSAWKKVILIDL